MPLRLVPDWPQADNEQIVTTDEFTWRLSHELRERPRCAVDAPALDRLLARLPVPHRPLMLLSHHHEPTANEVLDALQRRRQVDA